MTSTSIPEGWTENTLDELISLSNGINAGKAAYGRGTPFINVLEVITNESIDVVNIPGRVTLPAKTLARYRVERGDILFNRTSETQDEVGLTSVYTGDDPVVFGGFVFRGRPKTSRVDVQYSKYALRGAWVRQQITASGQGGIRANVGQRDLKRVRIALPDEAEQAAIAEALDDATTLIESLERVIAKKQAMKQGLMQQLLTGRTRLPGFVDEWTPLRLGDHVRYLKTVALSRAQLDTESPLRYLHYGDIHTAASAVLDAAHVQMPRASADKARGAELLAVGDLVLADASEDPAGVGKSVEVTSVPVAGVIPGLHTIAARFDKSILADGFKAYLQFIPDFRQSLLRLAAGTKVLATTRRFVSSVDLLLPGVDEQRAIACVLADADREVSALTRHLEKARDMKNGMMQQLLTGRVRLPPRGAQ